MDRLPGHFERVRFAALLSVCVALALLLILRVLIPAFFEPSPAAPRTHRFLLANIIPGEVKVYSPVAAPAALFRRCDDEVERCVRLFSNYLPDSEISRLNDRAAREDVAVSTEMAEVLACAREAWALTDGAFDITVFPLVRAWKEAGRKGVVPSNEELAGIMAVVGMDKVDFDPDTRRLRFQRTGVQMDLGGISKGYIVDRLVAILRAAGVRKGLVNIGGDLRVFGGSGAAPFDIGIQHPLRAGELVGYVRIADGAVATSGDYEQFQSIAGRRRSHILDPRSGQPVAASPSVTVLAPEAMRADALATGFSVLGADTSLAVAGKISGVECLFIRTNADGRLESVSSPEMSVRFRPSPAAGIARVSQPRQRIVPGNVDSAGAAPW